MAQQPGVCESIRPDLQRLASVYPLGYRLICADGSKLRSIPSPGDELIQWEDVGLGAGPDGEDAIFFRELRIGEGSIGLGRLTVNSAGFGLRRTGVQSLVIDWYREVAIWSEVLDHQGGASIVVVGVTKPKVENGLVNWPESLADKGPIGVLPSTR